MTSRATRGASGTTFLDFAGGLRIFVLDTLSTPEDVVKSGFFNVASLPDGAWIWVSARDAASGARTPMALHVVRGAAGRGEPPCDIEVAPLRFYHDTGIGKGEAARLVNRLERAAERAEAALAKLGKAA